jgi:ribosomal subunit interface protein
MKINVQFTTEVSDSVRDFIDTKLMPLGKFIKHFEETGEAEIHLEIGRTSKHHRKGEVYKAVANLQLPKKMLRAEEYAEDVRTAIDQARTTLRGEIDKYKTQFVEVKKKKLAK